MKESEKFRFFSSFFLLEFHINIPEKKQQQATRHNGTTKIHGKAIWAMIKAFPVPYIIKSAFAELIEFKGTSE